MTEQQLCNASELAAAIDRMADAILADFGSSDTSDTPDYALVGLYRAGVPLAERLVAAIAARGGKAPVLGKLDVTMYRDDIGLRRTLPLIRETVIPFNLEGAKVILVDDVLSSGRTIRAALDALTSYGRPALIRLAVLIDRNHPEYPIRPDYVGMRIELPADQKIVVSLPDDPAAATAYTKPASPPEA